MDLGETVGIFFPATFPNSGIRARSMRRFYARVEHKVVVGDDLFNLLAVTSLILIRRHCGMKGPDRLTHTLT